MVFPFLCRCQFVPWSEKWHGSRSAHSWTPCSPRCQSGRGNTGSSGGGPVSIYIQPSIIIHMWYKGFERIWTDLGLMLHHIINPFTPESDQCQNSPAASQEIWHHTVWRTWLFIAYSDEKWLYYKFSLHHSYNRFLKGWENTLFELRSERGNQHWGNINISFKCFNIRGYKSLSIWGLELGLRNSETLFIMPGLPSIEHLHSISLQSVTTRSWPG